MRLIGALLTSVALLLGTAVAATAEAPAPSTCRQKWGNLAQLHGESGNPGGSNATEQLQRRWDRFQEAARRLSREAKRADCAKLGGTQAAWTGLERLQHGLQRHDYLFRLRLANGDLHQFRDRNGRNPGRQVMRAFRFLREQAPRAAGDLSLVVSAARALNTSERAQVTGYLRDYRAAARASRHGVKAHAWLRIIREAELRE